MVILFGVLFIALKIGIVIDNLKINNYQISKLYIKLDKKLTLKLSTLKIERDKSRLSMKKISDSIGKAKYLFTFFQEIELKNIEYNNNNLSFLFKNNRLKIENKDYIFIGDIFRKKSKIFSKKSKILSNFDKLYIKEYNLTLVGVASYDYQKDILLVVAKFNIDDIEGKFSLSKIKEDMHIYASTKEFNNLKKLIDKFDIDESIRIWIVKKVLAKSYKLQYFKTTATLKDNKFKILTKTIDAKMIFNDSKIYFKDKLEPILTDKLILRYKENNLYFDLDKPKYLDKPLEGSSVSVLNLENRPILKVDIRIKSIFDKKVDNLLKAYNISLPIKQNGHKLYVKVLGDISLVDDYTDFIVDVNIFKSNLFIGSVELPIKKGLIHYQNKMLYLKKLFIKDNFYGGEVNGKINLKTKIAKLILKAEYLKLGKKKDEFFVLKNKKLPFILNYKNDIKIIIPKLSFKFINRKNYKYFIIKNLNKIKPYLVDKNIIENGGNLEIWTKNFKKFHLQGNIKKNNCFIYEKNNVCKNNLPIEITIDKFNTTLYAFNKRLYYNKRKNLFKLKNLNIDIKRLLKIKNKSKNKKSMIILGKNSHLRYGKYNLLTDSYNVKIKPNGNIVSMGSIDGDIIKFNKIKDKWFIQALRIKDKFLQRLTNFKGLKKGRYSIKKWGNPKTIMNGDIIIEGGILKDFEAYDKVLKFIKTIPSLQVLNNLGLDKSGFKIEKGLINYQMISDKKLIFKSFYIKGKEATIVGKGSINLVTNKIDMKLGIEVARKIGNIIGSIPILGYILMGSDNSLTVGLNVTGNLSSPKVETSVTKEILTLPLELIKRTLEAPTRLIK